jgi:4-hydroxy-tetrahydrodipicolinate synthase
MPKPDWMRGIFPALVTPFTRDEEINEDALRGLVRYLRDQVDGFVPCGTTGEFVYLTPEEKKKVISITLEEAGGKPVLAGTGCSSTRATLELTRWARDNGARGSLVVSPFYFHPTYNEVYQHFDKLMELDFPIVMYNIPQCSGVHKEWWTAEGIAQLPNIVGIKDSSGHMPFVMSLFEKIGGKVAIFCGHDEIGSAALEAGADGVILASANILPDIWGRIFKEAKSGDPEVAHGLQKDIQKIVRIIVRNGGGEAVKQALRLMGHDMGIARKPLMEGDACRWEDIGELRSELQKLGKIPKKAVEYHIGKKVVKTDLHAIPDTPSRVTGFELKVGEGFAGPPVHEIAHIDLALGMKDGPVGRAMEKALAREESKDQLRIVREKPRILVVPTVTVRGKRMAELVFTHAAEGINLAVDHSVNDGFLPDEIHDDIVMIANVFVHPSAWNRKRVMFNNYKAMRYAIRKAIEDRPTLRQILDGIESFRHPFRYTP